MASPDLDALACCGVTNYRVPGQLTDHEQSAGSLCIGKQEQVVLGDAGSGAR